MADSKVRASIANLIGIPLGLILAFFLVAAPLFADGGTVGERMFSFFLDFVIYGVVSLGLAIISLMSRAYLSLSIPAVLIVISLYFMDGPYPLDRTLLFLIYPVVVIIGSIIPFIILSLARNRKVRG